MVMSRHVSTGNARNDELWILDCDFGDERLHSVAKRSACHAESSRSLCAARSVM